MVVAAAQAEWHEAHAAHISGTAAFVSAEAMLGMARAGPPLLMSVRRNDVTGHRRDCPMMREAAFDAATVCRNVDDSWAWRNIFVAATDAGAGRRASLASRTQTVLRPEARERVHWAQGRLPKKEEGGAACDENCHARPYGSPETRCEAIAKIDRMGVGGVILVFGSAPCRMRWPPGAFGS